MSLPDRGAGLLRKAIPSLSDDGMRGSLGVQLARCYWDAGQLVEAYQTFTESLPLLSPGPEARLAACDLADLCLETDRPEQAAAVAGEVMRSARDDDAGRRAAKTLAEAYSAQRMYERAAAVLSGQVAGPAGNKERHE